MTHKIFGRLLERYRLWKAKPVFEANEYTYHLLFGKEWDRERGPLNCNNLYAEILWYTEEKEKRARAERADWFPPDHLDRLSIIERLGLDTPRGFHNKARQTNHYPRGSGRTTAMLIHALWHSQRGPVVIIAHTHTYANDLQKQAREWARKADLDPSRISALGLPHYQDRLRGTRAIRFIDHHCHDVTFPSEMRTTRATEPQSRGVDCGKEPRT